MRLVVVSFVSFVPLSQRVIDDQIGPVTYINDQLVGSTTKKVDDSRIAKNSLSMRMISSFPVIQATPSKMSHSTFSHAEWAKQVDAEVASFLVNMPLVPDECKNDFSKGQWRTICCAADVTASDYYLVMARWKYPKQGGICSFGKLEHRGDDVYVDGQHKLSQHDKLMDVRTKNLIGHWFVWKRWRD